MADTFVRITNRDIYNKINDLCETHRRDHNEIIGHQLNTNGKVKLNRWVATTALSLAILALGFIIEHVVS